MGTQQCHKKRSHRATQIATNPTHTLSEDLVQRTKVISLGKETRFTLIGMKIQLNSMPQKQ
jgi:hypothetical protein